MGDKLLAIYEMNVKNILLYLFLLCPFILAAQESESEEPAGILYELDEGYANLQIVDGCFHLFFLNADKDVVPPVYSKALLHYEALAGKDKGNREKCQLTLEGDSLMHPKKVFHPYAFRVRVILLPEDGSDAEKVVLETEILRQD